MPHAPLRTLLATLAVLALAGCSDEGTPDSGAAVSSGDPAACPGEVVEVTVSVGQWSDVARRLGGACATVTTVAAASPRDAEPVAADLAAMAGADLVLLNGAGYDEWATEAAGSGPVVVSAEEVGGAARRAPDVDPHLWYDPAVVPEVAEALARELAEISPDAAPYFEAQHTTWTAELGPYLAAVAGLRAEAEGRSYAATDPVFDRMAAAVGLTDVTPRDYRRGARDDPSPAAVEALEAALREGRVDVLIRNGQADDDDVHERVRQVAEDAGVPVVDVLGFPDEDESFVEWQVDQLADLAAALGASS
ncbi:metal ABC transporter solute-binding protein, Zn/Mn family [Candidatus Blastococcus massiliensis]|uniref:metal ABC transporter solute-binding protein, Zn/Mn family n=1 Tax=Candidatus Blastococcus massiliensis TaxID=1470358 RepID=UPI0004BBFF20|nr:zinc ABC transporter substrate-binding protein [Candidatus Blastococcus massiliensis]